jgi:DNA-directed RNA polymerase subunit RPC12/RpoP
MSDKLLFHCPICGLKDVTKQSAKPDPVWKEITVLNCSGCHSKILIKALTQNGTEIKTI